MPKHSPGIAQMTGGNLFPAIGNRVRRTGETLARVDAKSAVDPTQP